MTRDEYDAFCGSLPHATRAVQWGGAHVWKIAGKVFAIAWFDDAEPLLRVTFKCSDLSYDLLKGMPGLRPAPYMASRGLKWIQRTGQETMDDAALRDYVAESYRLVAAGLPRRTQTALGLGAPKAGPGTLGGRGRRDGAGRVCGSGGRRRGGRRRASHERLIHEK